MASPESSKGSMTASTEGGGSLAVGVIPTNGSKEGRKIDGDARMEDPKPEESCEAMRKSGEGGGDILSDEQAGKDGPNDNLRPEGAPENIPNPPKLAEKSHPQPEGSQLTVIDGPLAKGALDEGSSVAGGTASRTASVADERSHTMSHTPNSSMGSSLGELLGESSAILENGAIEQSDSPTGSLSDLVSTEKPGHKQGESHHISSKSTSEMDIAAVGVGEKPPLKHTESSPPDNAASAFRRARSPHRQVTNRERINSSQDIAADLGKGEDDDDDDDDENDIPPHIQSKIVEKSPAERYIRFKEKLGSGAYKDVFRAYDTIEGIEVAWNVVKLSGVPKVERVRIVNEVRLLERLHHPNIISFHGSWVNRETERVIFVTEILSSGTLKSFVQKVQLIRWKIFKRWAIQILKGLEYLHSQDPPIIHRDLKCDNIFINGTSGDLRIGDFGLSTAINKKNQPLSVLGTPEFMAPELYDENYNEKVDIYAFGMLLLEIITRDVPYHECSNPAQIYKKVTQGIPPSSLRRVKSEDARNFILLCLGIGEDANSRPSASDLLKHEFLAKKSDDETTIEVEPAVEDMPIPENRGSMTFSDTGSERSGGSKNDQKSRKYSSSIDGHEIPSRGAGAGSPTEHQGAKPPRSEAAALPNSKSKSMESKDTSPHARGNSTEEEQGDDHFGEMPENEANMKKVTVLMGRGTALDDEEPPAKEMEVVSLSSTPPPASINLPKATLPRSTSEAETSSLGSAPQYKVSAVPPEGSIEGQGANIKPYPNDAINLALTLPDESQTTIEFEFDLVNDDPVQVAREMVTELDEVPDNKVLDISEAISGVARQARMKQNQWSKIQQQAQQQQQNALVQQQALQHQQAQQQHQMAMHPQGSVAMQPQGSMQGSVPMQPLQGIQAPQGTIMMPQQHMYGSGIQGSGYPPTTGNFQNPGGSLVQPQLGTPGADPSASVMGGPASTTLQQQQQQQQSQSQIQPPPPAPSQMSAPQPPPMANSQPPQHITQPPPPPAPSQMSTPQPPPTQLSTPQPPQPHQMHTMPRQSVSVPSSPAPPVPQATSQQQHYPSAAAAQKSTLARSQSMELPSHTDQTAVATSQMLAQPTVPPPQPHLPPTQDMIAPRQLAPPIATQDPATKTLQSQDQASASSSIPPKQQIQSPLQSQSSRLSVDSVDGSEADTEEIRKLEQEFEKKMQRAKKSYGTRMDNLHRSKEEAEAQHLMTLEKHEKERVEFEKRVRLAEEEQTRRLNQIQKEFIEKKKEARQQRSKQPSAGVAGMQQNGSVDAGSCATVNGSRPPLHGGHKRSSSHFDTSSTGLPLSSSQNQQASPMLSDHKRNSSESNIPDAIQTVQNSQQQQIPQPPRSLPPNLPKSASVSRDRDRSGSTSS